ncbi:MAG: amino-acid N-acetyltransferase, partial [SAR86 cluster bacterium]
TSNSESPQFVDWFRSSTSYINAHRNKVFVVLLTGETLAHDNFSNIVYDLGVLHSLGVKLVLVHGARPQINEALSQAELSSDFHHDLRITPPQQLHIIKQVIGGLSVDIEASFSMGLANSPMHGANINLCRGNFITAKPMGIHDGIDYQYTGVVRKIQTEAMHRQLAQNNTVLLSNLGYSLSGEVFNLSAEEVATEVAIALQADKLLLFTPSEGVMNADGSLVSSLSKADALNYIGRNKSSADSEIRCISHALSAALKAFENNVHRSHLISYRENGALLQELFTRQGKGSLISADNFEALRAANIDDVAEILELIKPLEVAGSLVARSRELLEIEIANFRVIELEGTIIACAALYPLDETMAEVACIAIHPDYRRSGYGEQLLAQIEAQATRSGLKKMLALTTVASHWFLERGFVESQLDDLPEDKKALYNFQRNSKVLIKTL